MDVLYGLHPVEEVVRSGSRGLDHVIVARERRDERLERLLELCRRAGVRVSMEPREQLTRLAKTDAHQGVVAMVQGRKLLVLQHQQLTPLDHRHHTLVASVFASRVSCSRGSMRRGPPPSAKLQ